MSVASAISPTFFLGFLPCVFELTLAGRIGFTTVFTFEDYISMLVARRGHHSLRYAASVCQRFSWMRGSRVATHPSAMRS